ncbi:hypothetical protein Ancab_026289, partial [Ancistrocladus abbreviatus]
MGQYREQPRSSSEEDRMWLKDCWYGEVFSIEDLLGLECKIKESGVMDYILRYIGGKGVLLSSNGSRNIKEIVAEHKNVLNQWFALIRPWGTLDVEEATMFDGFNVLSRFNEWHLMFSASSSYVEDSLIGQNLMGDKSPATKAVENHPTVVHSGEEGAVADLSITLQNESRIADKG